MISFVAVSYTHLDVYKRQIERLRKYLKDNDFDIEVYIYSMKYGVL